MSVVFALATPPAKSAICVFRVSGAGCFVGLSKLLKGSKYNIGEFHVRSFFDESGLIDRAGLVAFKGPKAIQVRTRLRFMPMVGLVLCLLLSGPFKSVGFEEAVGGEFTKELF